MESKHILFIALACHIYNTFKTVSGADNECGLKCCSFNYRKNGYCKECESGTFRLGDDDDSACKPCIEPYYGYRCNEVCTCSITERCDNKFGCICKSAAHTNCRGKPDKDAMVTENKPENKDNSNTWYFISLGVVIAVLSVLGIGIYNARKRCLRRNFQQRNVPIQSNDSDLDHEYQYIDAENVRNMSKGTRAAIPVYKVFGQEQMQRHSFEQNITTLSTEKNGDSDDGYLHPIYKMNSSVESINILNLDGNNDHIEDRNFLPIDQLSVGFSKKDTIDHGYLNPYNHFSKVSVDCHQYDQCRTANDSIDCSVYENKNRSDKIEHIYMGSQ